MFDITPDDIALLDDADTRTLVGRLCESEMRRHGLPISAVTYGGHQDAPDGGVDVRVSLPDGTVIEGFISRAATCLQVKKPEMRPADIRVEMRPSGVIRPVIAELARRGGSYVIVSTGSNVTDAMLNDRLTAMRDVVRDVPGGEALHVDFIDRARLATWVGDHPARILWVRDRIGRAFSGWQPYGPWAYPHEGLEAEYLIDGKLRIETGRREDGDGLDALHAIRHIRDLLREPGHVARIVGLSGVGKTRFVQTLFDERVGEQCLDPGLVFYTDMGRDPDPVPLHLASSLVATKTRAILIVDNCGMGPSTGSLRRHAAPPGAR